MTIDVPGAMTPDAKVAASARIPTQSLPARVTGQAAVTVVGQARVHALTADSIATQLFDRSGGNVISAPPGGPVLRPPGEVRRVQDGLFVPALSRGDRILMAALTIGWLVCLLAFWSWWFEPPHRAEVFGTIVNSTLLIYLSVLPASFVIAANRLRRVDPATAVPVTRVAFVVTRAPSEPWPVARTTLTAMLAQDFPGDFDVWLCDEDPSDEIAQWCRSQGVSLSTRRAEPDYHRADWPRRTRCKEGNLAWFYDTVGYRRYDVVAQLDCDHVPEPEYLAEMVRPFADPAIGFVAAPSVCDANAAESWAARSRLYREAFFHGPYQAGHNDGLSPACIGSHYAVRTRALSDIGGVGPELAEDFSTSFLLTSAGWHGAFALDAHARGDGPHTFAAMITQEFQWSRSLHTLAFEMLPSHVGRLSWRLRIRYANALFHYALLALTTLVGLSLPPIAAITGINWVHVNYLQFLVRWGAVAVWPLGMAFLLRHRRLMRPRRAPVLSWEAWLGAMSRWPFIAWGVAASTWSLIRPRVITFKVTPKTRDGLEPLPVQPLLPYLAITIVMSVAALIGERNPASVGYVFLCLFAGTCYCVVALAVSLLHARETARAAGAAFLVAVRATVRKPLLISLAATPPLVLAIALYPAYAMHALV
jgi:cellulose synthase/poly-beta-1,6-N-acetylglucosamine synthase-like glycosyltransferase